MDSQLLKGVQEEEEEPLVKKEDKRKYGNVKIYHPYPRGNQPGYIKLLLCY